MLTPREGEREENNVANGQRSLAASQQSLALSKGLSIVTVVDCCNRLMSWRSIANDQSWAVD